MAPVTFLHLPRRDQSWLCGPRQTRHWRFGSSASSASARGCLGCHLARSIGFGQRGSWAASRPTCRPVQDQLRCPQQVAEVLLASLFERHGRPKLMRSDNGREFIADSLKAWLVVPGVGQVVHREWFPAAERLMSKGSTARCAMRSSTASSFRSVLEARVVLADRVEP